MTGVDTDLALIRSALKLDVRVPGGNDGPLAALARVEAELARLREERDALRESGQRWAENVRAKEDRIVALLEERAIWRQKVEDSETDAANARASRDELVEAAEAEAESLRDENRKLRGVWKAEKEARFVEITAHQETSREAEAMADAILAAEARCARLQQALREIVGQDPVENALDPQWAARIAREALAGPDTPADPDDPYAYLDCTCDGGEEGCSYCSATPADSQEDKT